MKQTAVEWLEDWMGKNQYFIGNDLLNAVKQAKEMEKAQIKDSFVECWKANVPEGVECKLDAEQ